MSAPRRASVAGVEQSAPTGFPWADVLIPTLVAIVAVPIVQFVLGRRSAQAQGAFQSRVAIYEEMLTNLTGYREYVQYMPPNRRSEQGIVEPDPKQAEKLELAMRLHASPILRIYIKELLQALDESKGQSWAFERALHQMEVEPPKTFQSDWAFMRSGEHMKRKAIADKWAASCLERVKQRMRWELYGFMKNSWWLRLRTRPVAKRVMRGKTGFFTAGADQPPPELLQKYGMSEEPTAQVKPDTEA